MNYDPSRLSRAKATLLTLVFALTSLHTTRAQAPAGAPVQKEPPAPGSLADYRFDGNGKDEYPWGPEFELVNAEFQDGALALSGKYEMNKDKDGYRAVVKCPSLDYNHFTVALRFKADDFSANQIDLFTGGIAFRWFALSRSRGGKLTVTLNNQRFSHEVQAAPLATGKWTVVACGVDLTQHKVAVYFNGRKAVTFDLPPTFKLDVAEAKGGDADKRWTFTNYSNGTTFHGLVDECIIYGGMLTDDEFAKIPLRP